VSIIYLYRIGSSADCVAVLAPTWLFGASLWLHLATVALFAFGLVVTLRREATAVRGTRTLVRFGPLFFAVPLAVFGMQHFALFDSVKFGVPGYMPGRFFWAYLVGAALIAACLSMLTEIQATLAALLVGIMLFLFIMMIHLPNLMENPHDRFAITVPLRDLALSGGALSLAGVLGRGPSARWLLQVGRWFFAAPMLYFGVEHFLHPAFAPGVPLPLLTPTWIPGHRVWAYATGAILVVCGLSILVDKHAQAAATWLGSAFLVLVVLIYLPMEIVHPSIAISGELDYVADTLAMSGAALLVARAMAGKDAQDTISCAGADSYSRQAIQTQ
jgi:uncharacterized membrane protein